MKKIMLPIALVIIMCNAFINASLDPEFNPGGTPPGTLLTSFDEGSAAANGVAIQSDEKIVAVGFAYGFIQDQTSGETQFALARYNSKDGTLDPSFGPDGTGKVTTIFNFDVSNATAVAITYVEGIEKIIVAGEVSNYTFETGRFALARYDLNGILDDEFGGNNGDIPGTVTTSFDNFIKSEAHALLIDNDGNMVLAGSAHNGNRSSSVFALARYDVNGKLDESFGGKSGDKKGTVTTQFNGAGQVNTIVCQSNGDIVAGGSAEDMFALARYKQDGKLDGSFGIDGKRITDIVPNKRNTILSAAVQDTDKIVVVGTYDKGNDGFAISMGVIARYTKDGTLDSTFGTNGSVIAQTIEDMGNTALALDDQQRIVTAGTFAGYVGEGKFVLVRFDSEGKSVDLKVSTAFERPNSLNHSNALAIQKDHKIVLAGIYSTGINTDKFALARYIPTAAGTSSALSTAIKNKYC